MKTEKRNAGKDSVRYIIPDDLYQRLKESADAEGVTVDQLAARVIRQRLKNGVESEWRKGEFKPANDDNWSLVKEFTVGLNKNTTESMFISVGQLVIQTHTPARHRFVSLKTGAQWWKDWISRRVDANGNVDEGSDPAGEWGFLDAVINAMEDTCSR